MDCTHRISALAKHLLPQAVTGSAGGEGPLAGILVVEMGVAVAGPLAATVLADMGADVIKVESPYGVGDMNRVIGPQREGEAIYMHNCNRGKRAIVLDPKIPEGREALLKLLAKADVFLQNLRPGVMERMGISYDEVQKINPRIIYLSISGFGSDGPYAHLPAMDGVVQAKVGFPVMQGAANGAHAPPVPMNTLIVDKATAWNGAQSILAALYAREAGKCSGQHIKLSMLDAGANFLWPDGMSLSGDMLVNKDPASYQGARGTREPKLSHVFPTRDGYGILMIWPESTLFGKALRAFAPSLVADKKFANIESSRENFPSFLEEVRSTFAKLTNEELHRFLDEHGLPGSVIIDPAEFHLDPQVKHNGLVLEHDVGPLGLIREVRPAPLMSATPLKVGGWLGSLGAHTCSVLREVAGYTQTQIESLRSAGVFGNVNI